MDIKYEFSIHKRQIGPYAWQQSVADTILNAQLCPSWMLNRTLRTSNQVHACALQLPPPLITCPHVMQVTATIIENPRHSAQWDRGTSGEVTRGRPQTQRGTYNPRINRPSSSGRQKRKRRSAVGADTALASQSSRRATRLTSQSSGATPTSNPH